jgi:hypothetical protein
MILDLRLGREPMNKMMVAVVAATLTLVSVHLADAQTKLARVVLLTAGATATMKSRFDAWRICC